MKDKFDVIGFKKVGDHIDGAVARTREGRKNVISYGNPFLDTVLKGILPGELVLVGGETGTGKTEMVKTIVAQAADAGKKCAGIWLEAEEGENELRECFSIAAWMYRKEGGKERPEYRNWLFGENQFLEPYIDKAAAHIKKHQNQYSYYKSENYTSKDMVKQISALDGDIDLVAIDHLHFFSLTDDSNENREIADIMTQARRLTQVLGVSMIMIAHLRKRMSGEQRGDIPRLDDFKGTAAIIQIPTTVILFGQGERSKKHEGCFETFMQVQKIRAGGKNRTSVAGKLFFDPKVNRFIDDWEMGRIDNYMRFHAIDKQEDVPYWAQQGEVLSE